MFPRLVFLSLVLSISSHEIKSNDSHGDLMQDVVKSFMKLPLGFGVFHPQTRNTTSDETTPMLEDLFKLDEIIKLFRLFNDYIKKGTTLKGLTFNIYDDNMREAAITLFRIFQNTHGEVFRKVSDWAMNNVNREMYMYALRLESLYGSNINESNIEPPFIWNPNYFVNSETLAQASLIADEMRKNQMVNARNAIFDLKNEVVINTNYSGWNLPQSSFQDNLNYFREDVGLNSYHLGLHLLHPFWMSDEELEKHNPRYAEHYYYTLQQLMARYNLEKLHLKDKATTNDELYGWDYIPYLSYKSGLSFPTRTCMFGNQDNETALLKTISDEIRDCISKDKKLTKNGTSIIMLEESDIINLVKLIRTSVDGVKLAKIVRSEVEYGGNTLYPIDKYNPAPSVIYHPETSLRDPVYWLMIQEMLSKITHFKNTLKPYDLSQYETEDFQIVDYRFSELTTYFDDYIFPVNYAISNTFRDASDLPYYVSVKQRRINHEDLSLTFFVASAVKIDTVIRLYLGPGCGNNCWAEYYKFYEVETFRFTLEEGLNLIYWYPEQSERFSFDNDFNSTFHKPGSTKYSIYRFPKNLMIPRGLKEGLKLTLFVMLTPADNHKEILQPECQNIYKAVSTEYDSKPLGFPFHRQATGFNDTAYNYRFYNITIYHKQKRGDKNDYFSPYLY